VVELENAEEYGIGLKVNHIHSFDFYLRRKYIDMWWMALYAAALFFVLTPGIVLSLPPGGSKTTVALTHAAVFGAAWMLTHKLVWKAVH